MTYTFERAFNDLALDFGRYHGMGVQETKDYFESVGIVPYMQKWYSGLAYEPDLEMIAWLRREIAELGQPLPKQLYFKTMTHTELPAKP